MGRKVLAFIGPNLAAFWTEDPLIVNLKAPNSENTRVSIGTRLLSHQACESDQNCDLLAGRGNRKRKNTREESHKTVIFHHHVEAPLRN